MPGIIMYPLNLTTQNANMRYIKQQAFLYPDTSSYNGAASGDGSQQGFVYWSANQPSNSSKQWVVRAVIFDSFQTHQASQTALNTTNFQFSVMSTSRWTLPLMYSTRSLNDWAAYMYGQTRGWYPPRSHQSSLEQVLSTMSILSGSGNAWQKPLVPGQERKYGCLVDCFNIGIEIYIVLSVFVFLLLLVLGVDLYSLIYYKLGRTSKIDDELSCVPTDLLSWQLAMVKRSTGNDHLTNKDLGNISYAYVKTDNNMRP